MRRAQRLSVAHVRRSAVPPDPKAPAEAPRQARDQSQHWQVRRMLAAAGSLPRVS